MEERKGSTRDAAERIGIHGLSPLGVPLGFFHFSKPKTVKFIGQSRWNRFKVTKTKSPTPYGRPRPKENPRTRNLGEDTQRALIGGGGSGGGEGRGVGKEGERERHG